MSLWNHRIVLLNFTYYYGLTTSIGLSQIAGGCHGNKYWIYGCLSGHYRTMWKICLACLTVCEVYWIGVGYGCSLETTYEFTGLFVYYLVISMDFICVYRLL